MMAADGGARARADLAGANGRHVPQMTWLLENLAQHALSAGEYFEVLERWSAFRSRMQLFIGRHDVVISPVAPGPAPLHGCRPGDDRPVETYVPWANAMAHSVAGVPVAVVPVGERAGPAAGRAHRGRAVLRSRRPRGSGGGRAGDGRLRRRLLAPATASVTRR